MKYIIKDWDKKYDGILYFVQRLEEMLFHYSDDIVKAPVHNTVTLINEYIELDQDDTIQDFHGELVASELVESIQNDELIKEKDIRTLFERTFQCERKQERN